jgi:hypothetical protein
VEVDDSSDALVVSPEVVSDDDTIFVGTVGKGGAGKSLPARRRAQQKRKRTHIRGFSVVSSMYWETGQ